MSIMEWFEGRSIPEPNTGCRLWLGGGVQEYGALRFEGEMRLAHRVAYELFVGPIPEGLMVCTPVMFRAALIRIIFM